MTQPVPAGSLFSVQPLSIFTTDSSPSLLIHFNNTRYLFNTPESISRVCVQGRIGLKKVDTIFLGSLEASAGLPGVILSTVETGNNKLKVVGPPGSDHLLASCRSFTRRDQLSLKLATTEPLASTSTLPPPIHSDENLVVHAIPLTPRSLTPPPPLKRKRSSSSSPERPRSKSPPPLPNSSSSSASFPPSKTTTEPLYDASSPSFDPSKLRDASASHWRSQVISDMFRGQAFSPPPVFPLATRFTPSRLQALLPPPPEELYHSPIAVSYLAVGPPIRGKFNPLEARKRGVGDRKFSKLAKGERVWVPKLPEVEVEVGKKLTKAEIKKAREERNKLENEVKDGEGEGQWVDPLDCMGAQISGSTCLILNIPDPSYLPSLLSISPTLFTTHSSSELKDVFYILGPSVLSSPSLHFFSLSLPPSVTHHFSSPDIPSNNPITFVPTALLSLRLSYLSSSIFNLPKYTLPPTPVPIEQVIKSLSPSSEIDQSTPTSISLPEKCKYLDPNQVVHYGGVQQVPPSTAGSFDFLLSTPEASLAASTLKSPTESPPILAKASSAWTSYVSEASLVKTELEESKQIREKEKRVGDGLEITTLGTGSAIPSKYRNVSSTLIFISEEESGEDGKKGYILLDAGEGTWGQLTRRFGEEVAREEVLRGLKVVFISHMHQDHHAGLVTILKERNKLSPPAPPLTVIAPGSAKNYLVEQQKLFDLGLAYPSTTRFIDNFVMEKGKTLNPGLEVTRESLYESLGLANITTVPVLHRCRAWGISIEHKSGWKIVFSGDTMPCDALVDAGMGATLLIHEATIQDDMPEVALAKGHSTFGQAIDIAKRMKARHLLLTHFSARYPKLPPLIHAEGEDEEDTIVAMAFDLMTLRLDEFWMAEKFRAPMDTLLGWDDEDGSTVGDTMGVDGDIGG